MTAPMIVEKREAKANGLLRYFTGKPCKHGHIAERLVSCGKCMECGRLNTRKWAKENQNAVIAYRKSLSPAQKDAARARTKRWVAENPERQKETYAAWYENNRAKVVARSVQWAAANPEKYKSSRKRWEENNPEYRRSYVRNRRAKMRSARGSHTAKDISEITALQGNRCAYCRDKIKKGLTHVDHIIAVTRGGSNDRSNLQILCRSCNVKKHAKDPIDFARQIGLLL